MSARLVAALAGAVLTLMTGCAPAPSDDAPISTARTELSALEARLDGRLGLHAVDTGTGSTIGHRDQERFASCSTAKALLAAAVLQRAETDVSLLARTVRWRRDDLVRASPVTSERLATGATVAELAQAAVSRSDNTAANLLHAEIGGPAASTAFVRSLGDPVTRLDHLEPMPRVVGPADPRDSTTPGWLSHDVRELAVGSALSPAGRDRLTTWLRRASTGLDQIRAAVPPGWVVGDKTGACSQGFANDVAVIWPPGRAPIVLSVFTAPRDPTDPATKATIAEAARIALRGLGVLPPP